MKDISKLLFSYDEINSIEKIMKCNAEDQTKAEFIKTQFLSLFLRHSDIAKTIVQEFRNNKTVNPILSEMEQEIGKLIKSDLEMYKMYGATYKELVSVLNAPQDIISEIEGNQDTSLAFDELILKYDLADSCYPHIKLVLNK